LAGIESITIFLTISIKEKTKLFLSTYESTFPDFVYFFFSLRYYSNSLGDSILYKEEKSLI